MRFHRHQVRQILCVVAAFVLFAGRYPARADWWVTSTTWTCGPKEVVVDPDCEEGTYGTLANVSPGFTEARGIAKWCILLYHSSHYVKAFAQCCGARTIRCDDTSPEIEATASVGGSTTWETSPLAEWLICRSDGRVHLYLGSKDQAWDFSCKTFPDGPKSAPFSRSLTNIVHDQDKAKVYYRSDSETKWKRGNPWDMIAYRAVSGTQPTLDFRE